MEKAGDIFNKTQPVAKAARRAKRQPDPEKKLSLAALTVPPEDFH